MRGDRIVIHQSSHGAAQPPSDVVNGPDGFSATGCAGDVGRTVRSKDEHANSSD
jgi:hypothetical protein